MGRINSEVIPPAMLFHGWNMLGHNAGYVAARLREMQEEMRAELRYDLSDRLRDLHQKLNDALSYVGIQYVDLPPDDGRTK